MAAHPSQKTYVVVWGVLLVLLFVTWVFSRIDLGTFNVVAAIGIAGLKMMFIILYFMHVRYSNRLTWLFVAAGFIWLLILLDLTLSDYFTRGFSWSQ